MSADPPIRPATAPTSNGAPSSGAPSRQPTPSGATPDGATPGAPTPNGAASSGADGRGGPGATLGRVAGPLLAATAIAAVVAAFHTSRMVEASVTSWLLHHVLGIATATSRTQPEVFFPLGHGHSFAGLVITPACSVVLMLVPTVALFGLLAAVSRARLPALLVAVVAAATVMAAANQVRLAVIVVSMRWLGFADGYQISHTYVGSALAVLGFAVGLWLFFRLLARSRRAA